MRFFRVLTAATVLLTLTQVPAFALAQKVSDDPSLVESKPKKYHPSEVIIKLKPGHQLSAIESLNRSHGVARAIQISPKRIPVQETILRLRELRAVAANKDEIDLRIKAQEQLLARLDLRQKRASGVPLADLSRLYLLKADGSSDVDLLVKVYRAHPAIEYAEPNFSVYPDLVPNDPYYSSSGLWGQTYGDLYGLKKIDTAGAWDLSTGKGIVVAVIDTGVDYNHRDLGANIWKNAAEILGNGIDEDQNGYVDDVAGWDFGNGDNDPIDAVLTQPDGYQTGGHGTHVAGTVAAIGHNSVGVVGVAGQAKVMAVKGFQDNGDGYTASFVAAVTYAAPVQ